MSEDFDGYDGGYGAHSGLFARHTRQDFTGDDADRIAEFLSASHRQRLELEPAPASVLRFAPGTLGAA